MLFFMGFRYSRPPLLSLVVRQRAAVTSTEAGFPKGDLGWRSSV